jgi:NADH/NAD ratio-sensing transcriptional regulator Rex
VSSSRTLNLIKSRNLNINNCNSLKRLTAIAYTLCQATFIMRRLIYKEDHQMYYFVPVVFETDSKITVEKMEKISYEPAGAGRMSTAFNKFKKLMEEYGYTVNEIERWEQNTIPENNTLEIVIGATGNY